MSDKPDVYDYLDMLESVASQVKEALTRVSVEGWKATLEVYRVEAIQAVVTGIFWIIVLPVFSYYFYDYTYSFALDYHAGNVNEQFWSFVRVTLSVGNGAVMIWKGHTVFNVWHWVALFKPQVIIAKSIRDKVLGQ